jgi:hypothetical protein
MSPEPWILAVDLGNGGPKVAAVTSQGEVLRTALRPVHVRIGLDGEATQDATEWWQGLTAATRELVGPGSDRPGCAPWPSPGSGGRRWPSSRRGNPSATSSSGPTPAPGT